MSDQENKPENTPETPIPTQETFSKDEVIKLVNAAVSSHIKRHTKQFDEMVDEKLSWLVESTSSKTEETQKNASEADKQLRQMQAQYQKVMKDLQAKEQQIADEQASKRDMNARNGLRDALASAGVPADRIRHAEAYLYDSQKRVRISESGDPVFVSSEGGYDLETAITEGVESFLKSDEGKMYLPAREVAGSGNRGGRAPASRAKTDNPQQAIEDMSSEEQIHAFLSLAFNQGE